jgi:hypothetical protein
VPIPLADSIAAALRTDRTAALAAAFVIGAHHADVLQWVVRTLRGDAPEPQPQAKPKANGAARRGRKANGHRKPRDNGGDSRLPARDEADKRLLEAMRKNPDGVINDWVMVVGKSRTSVVAGLHRLRAAGLAKSDEGKWALTEDPPPREPPAKWTAPLSAREHRAHT